MFCTFTTHPKVQAANPIKVHILRPVCRYYRRNNQMYMKNIQIDWGLIFLIKYFIGVQIKIY